MLLYFNTTDVDKSYAYGYAVGVILCSALNVFVIHPYTISMLHMGMKVRVACCSLIYRKTLKLTKTALGETTIGQAVNLLSNDVNRFDISIIFLHYLWLGPLETIIMTYVMYDVIDVGVSSVIGVAFLLMFIPLQGWLGKKSSELRLKTAIRTDARVRLTNEIISGIQAIKMYTWENPFSALIQKARKKEVNVIRWVSYIRGITMSFIMFTTRMSLFITVLAYVLFGYKVTAEKVFVVTAYYNSLRTTMTVLFPQGITQVAEARVSIKRLQKFLMYDEMTASEVEAKKHNKENNKEDAKDDKNAKDLLNVILKELRLQEGSIKVNGKIVYSSQEPWLFAGSVRQNILFGRKMDQVRYNRVTKVCQLKTDFNLLPYGDKTIVGERGISLSGGQRARINLARAVYADADIYLMDDPLSAVDAHVGKHMFEECIDKYLRGKTRILVTHQLQYLRDVGRIIVLKDGAIQAEGTYDELGSMGVDFGRLLENQAKTDEKSSQPPSITISRSNSRTSISSQSTVMTNDTSKEPYEVAEMRTVGNVSGKVYTDYFRAGGNWCIIFIVAMLCIIAQFAASGSDFFLAQWINIEEKYYYNLILISKSKNFSLKIKYEIFEREKFLFLRMNQTDDGIGEDPNSPLTRMQCIYIYSGLIVLTIIITLIRSWTFFWTCMRASMRLHDRMFRSISRATMRFFNTNTSGRVLNRFSKDMGAVDEMLPAAFIDCLQIGIALLGIIIVVATANVWLLIPTVLIGIVFYYMRIFYLATSRSVKRLEGITRSPVFAHLSATLQGLSTIRAFGAEAILTKEFDNYQDIHSSAWYIFISTSRAFGFWLDVFCVLYITLVTLSFLVLDNYSQGSMDGGFVGLAITQSIGLTGMFQWGMRQSAELENQMTSVERILEYNKVDSEPPLESAPDKKPKSEWPQEGKIEFKNLFLRYAPLEPPVLKNLNFVIFPREKIGIVGRTGAGKSSLIQALFRLSDMDGLIEIDEVDTSQIGLHDLRSKISIIPQEPFLFSGSLRRNLDPFDSYMDEPLWRALEEVELKEIGLEAHINEGGSNLSVGQRQLVCLARAIVRNNPILVLDEATANVDPRTDELIQTTIRNKFEKCTVLTIAHRLNTVMDSDRILVMDAGNVVEFDHPHVLLQKDTGYLKSMVQETGKAMAEVLASIAHDCYQNPKAWEKEWKAYQYRLEQIAKSGSQKKVKEPSLMRVLIRCFGFKTLLCGTFMAVIETLLRIVQPLLLGQMLLYFNTTDIDKYYAYKCAIGIILCSAVNVFVVHPYMMDMTHLGMKVRVACCSLIYRKTIIFLHYLWLGPLETIIITYITFHLIDIGISSIFGIAFLLMFIPFQDERVRLMNEIISGIQAIKMYTWENFFSSLIEKARKKEVNVIQWASCVRGIVKSFIVFMTRISLFITILSYILFGYKITAEKVYVITAYYNSLSLIMTAYFPQGITQVAETIVSIKRLQKFLMYDELTLSETEAKKYNKQSNKDTKENNKNAKENNTINLKENLIEQKNDSAIVDQLNNVEYSISIKNGNAKWLDYEQEDTLMNINMKVRPGELIAVVGQVGAGKSSLLNVILKELRLQEGSIQVCGRFLFTRSPIFAHLSATLRGLPTIRAFGMEATLTKEFDNYQDIHSSAWYISIASSRAFAFWVDAFCMLYITLVTLSFLVMDNGFMYGGYVGLAITQSINLTGRLHWCMRQSTEVENQMASVERILEYNKVDSEPPLESVPDKKPKCDWPQEGKIKFKNVSLRYAPLEPAVLKNLSFVIFPREKIGIVGRTGAGKSSLIQALFRLADVDGLIEIDEVDTSQIGLHDLRSKISIIPQEPFLFSGSLRRNLDPFDLYADELLWRALEEVELKEIGLEAHINDGGSNLSVGQRQLVCLARAIVKNNPILVLDEATANVDPRTDELIQTTIRRKFEKCTVLTIAHRLNTVMDSDRILVMDAGNAVEFDHPHVLLQKESGYLKSMVQETGTAMAEALAGVARNCYQNRVLMHPLC
ncbi:hypothetical protein ALC56_01160 [Trachymyrmex septentrionalis]|uniref:Multidrug resistance-associated protein lethal(2)03659 n=1 Tax=Trachymyrmex septentrionalis TaxID=34720 RepID=A0A195FVW8_9HYME|nr:hypothetical protein ALC56_01160 [Trachymyrmex septentrionalis]